MNKFPDSKDVYATIDATWPAAAFTEVDGWVLRRGLGGGSRVSAATAIGVPTSASIGVAESEMEKMGQTPQFMIREGDEALDSLLAGRGYNVKDPVNLYACALADLTETRPPALTSFVAWPPLACQKEVWESGGIGPARLAVMERAPNPKTSLLGRIGDTPVGTVFVSCSHESAMIHALEILPAYRRQGIARNLTIAAAFWAQENGARHMTLVTTKENDGANGLYTALGMKIVGEYHYRIKG